MFDWVVDVLECLCLVRGDWNLAGCLYQISSMVFDWRIL